MSRLIFTLSAVCIALFSISVSANAAFIPFKTQAQAEKYCPDVNALTFHANFSSPSSAGKITGNKNGISFESSNTIHPQHISAAGNIAGVAFGHAGTSIYGYQSGNRITCFYNYTNFTGGQTALNLQG